MRQINDQMAAHMVGELFTGFLDADDKAGKASPMDLSFLIGILRQMKQGIEGSSAFTSPWRSLFNVANETEQGYFWTEGKKYLLIFVEPAKKNEGQALTALRETIASLKTDFPDVSAGVNRSKSPGRRRKRARLQGHRPRNIPLPYRARCAAYHLLARDQASRSSRWPSSS